MVLFSAGFATADPATIQEVQTDFGASGWRFSVTLSHGDTGWDHYADGWDVSDEHGNQLGFRELLHPHVHEQPFTRSLGNVEIPDAVEHVIIRAKCSVDGWTSAPFKLVLSKN